jgi:glucans biosynthesis protein C
MKSPVAANQSIVRDNPSGRVYFLDNLKTFIILLVVFFHSAYAYALYLSQDWYVVDAQHNLFFDVFIVTAFAFMMPVMFFVAGYMGIGSLARKGQAAFWRDRLLRIIAPWALGVIVVAPAISYMSSVSRGIYPPYLSYWAHYFFGPEYQSHGQVHFYFLCVLTLYYAALSVAYLIYKPLGSRSTKKPSGRFLALFGVATGIFFFVGTLFFDEGRWVKIAIFDLPATKFIPFMCYFFLGVLAYRSQWFTPSGYTPRLRPWALMCFGSFIFFFVLLNPQLHTSTVGTVCYSLLQFFFCLTAVFSLLALFNKRFNFTTKPLSSLAANSYGTYFIHYLVIVLVIFILRDLRFNVFLKWLLAGTLSAAVSYLISRYLLSRTPLFGKTAKRVSPGPAHGRAPADFVPATDSGGVD